MKIYNTLSAEKEDFVPQSENQVLMYVCGPTVYDKAHLGHGRSMVAFDLVRRYFLYKGYEVNFVTNYTDIDDKMIRRANEEGISIQELAEKIIPVYERDYAWLNVLQPTHTPRATEYILEMMEMVKLLLKEGVAYELEDGVYFDVEKFPSYGKLSKQKLDELQHGARVEVNTLKRNPSDFVLWKNKKDFEPFYTDKDAILPEGRPGWHIECSVMSRELLGDTIDIHGGGQDLTFPHHECEIAQSETANKRQFARYWMHNGFIKIDGDKMSKSLNNFQTLESTFLKYDPLVVRYFLMSVHYRMPIDFTEALLVQAKASVARIQNFYHRVRNLEPDGKDLSMMLLLENAVRDFEKAMDDDFEISGALAAVFTLIREVNSVLDTRLISKVDQDSILSILEKFDTVLGILDYDEQDIDSEVEALIKQRDEARVEKNYAQADKIRDELVEMGIELDDTDAGTIWKRVKA